METIKFSEMAERHGEEKAYDLLLAMEKIAAIQSVENPLDRGARFQTAIEVLIKTNFAAYDLREPNNVSDKRNTN